MDEKPICPNCKKPLPAGAPMGMCPECLIQAGFNTGSEAGSGGTKFIPPEAGEIAKLFPQLEIIGFIGKGGMGAVYKARQPALDRFVALKILTPRAAGGPGFAERFNREARALARLSHPNIVAVHDFGQAGPLHYLIMEYVDGTNLREVERAARMTPEQALAIVPQICAALEFAHGEGIVHRDIKPENILIDTKGRVKITDFGIARILGDAPGKESLTGAKGVVGTPHYMAPEQIEKPLLVDHRADIFSLGVVFYEMLTGELPLGKFQPPSQKVQMDVRLDEVVLHALEKEPARRYQQAGQIKTEVETIATSPGGGVTSQEAINEAEWRNPANWSFGLYFSKRDSRKFFVPRRIPGLGWTVNLGHWQGAAALLGLLFLVIGAVAVFSLNTIPRLQARLPAVSGTNRIVGLDRTNRTDLGLPAVAPINQGVFSADEGGGRNPEVLRIRLRQAESELARLTQMRQSGVIPASDLEEARDKVELLTAELNGDKARIAQVKLAAAERALERLTRLHQTGMVPTSEFEEAQNQVEMLKAELDGNKTHVAQVKLAAAERALERVTRMFQAGMTTGTDVVEAQNKVDILKAEMEGDAVRVAQVKLASAQRVSQLATQTYQAGLGGKSELDAAQAEVEVREAELKALQTGQSGRTNAVK